MERPTNRWAANSTFRRGDPMTPEASDPFETSEYLASAGACALLSGCFAWLLFVSGFALSEFANWVLFKAGVSFRFLQGYTTAFVLFIFVSLVLSRSPSQGRSPSSKRLSFFVFSGSVTVALIGFALAVRVFEILTLPFTTLLVITYFVFCYSETFPLVRRRIPGS